MIVSSTTTSILDFLPIDINVLCAQWHVTFKTPQGNTIMQDNLELQWSTQKEILRERILLLDTKFHNYSAFNDLNFAFPSHGLKCTSC